MPTASCLLSLLHTNDICSSNARDCNARFLSEASIKTQQKKKRYIWLTVETSVVPEERGAEKLEMQPPLKFTGSLEAAEHEGTEAQVTQLHHQQEHEQEIAAPYPHQLLVVGGRATLGEQQVALNLGDDQSLRVRHLTDLQVHFHFHRRRRRPLNRQGLGLAKQHTPRNNATKGRKNEVGAALPKPGQDTR